MVQVRTSFRRTFAAVVVLFGSMALSGCDVAAALRHEDSVAREAGEGTSGNQGGGNSGGGAARPAKEPGGQHWTTTPTVQETCNLDEKTLTGIRVGKHDGFDRIVFDLSSDGAPCYWVGFDANPIQDGSGNPIDMGGYQAIRVSINGLGPDFPTIAPGYSAKLEGPHVKRAFFDTFFEGTATNFIAVPNGAAEYAVSVQPGKLIVDVRTR